MSGGPADQALVERCLGNDQDACALLVDQYARMVGTIIWRATQDERHVEDLVQETFMRVFRGLPYFHARSKLSTWICTVAHRVAVDHIRAQARARETSVELSVDETTVMAAPSAGIAISPEDATAQAELDALLHEELSMLPERYRLPLLYVALEELDYETVSQMLQMPIGTVKANVFYAKRTLKDRLNIRMRIRNHS
jgi:RNA polymerase sigma-70 factor (ECF subfamily)